MVVKGDSPCFGSGIPDLPVGFFNLKGGEGSFDEVEVWSQMPLLAIYGPVCSQIQPSN